MSFTEYLQNSVLITAILGWFVAQVLKVLFILVRYRKWDFRRMIGSGGMPSSHSSFVMSLATGVGCIDGFDSTLFSVCIVFALVVMYDAAGVRRAAGQQAKILNQIVEEWKKDDHTKTEKKLKELLGHTPKEVFAGAVLGVVIGLLRHF